MRPAPSSTSRQVPCPGDHSGTFGATPSAMPSKSLPGQHSWPLPVELSSTPPAHSGCGCPWDSPALWPSRGQASGRVFDPRPSRCSRPWLPPTGRAGTGIWGDGRDHRWWLLGSDGWRRSDRGRRVCSVAIGAAGEGRWPAGGLPRPRLEPTPSNLSTHLPPTPSEP